MNPILQALNRGSNPVNRLPQIMQALSGQNPQVVYDNLMRSNPQFAAFVNANRGKSPQQIATDYGINPSIIEQILK